jgi:hypothetical protein
MVCWWRCMLQGHATRTFCSHLRNNRCGPNPQVDGTCQAVFNYVAQGLFERHKLIVSTQLCMSVLRARGELQRAKFDMLLRGQKVWTWGGGQRAAQLAIWAMTNTPAPSALPCP